LSYDARRLIVNAVRGANAKDTLESHSFPSSNASASLVEVVMHAMTGRVERAAAQVQSRAQSHAQFLGLVFGPLRTVCKICAACVCIAILFKLLGGINCGSKRCDCRRIRCCGKCLYHQGWDEFETFRVVVSVHSLKDAVGKGMLGGQKNFYVKIAFKWSQFQTVGTTDMRWEQTRAMDVPQGASECVISLLTEGRFGNTRIGGVVLEVKKQMLDRGDEFWGEKQQLSIEMKDTPVGKLVCTFRRVGEGEADGTGGGGGGGSLGGQLIKGIEVESALGVECHKACVEAKEEGRDFGAGPLEGDEKLELLGRVLCGPLRLINKKGKETDNLYCHLVHCNYAEWKSRGGQKISSSELKSELKKQMEKARGKGLLKPEKKWYWAWYPSRKDYDHSWEKPDGFIAIIGLTSVHRTPKRQDEFVLHISEDGVKDELRYRREAGKDLNCWIDGMEKVQMEVRDSKKAGKNAEKRADVESKGKKAKVDEMKNAMNARGGYPQNDEQWKAWFEYFKGQGYQEELIRQLWQECEAERQKAMKKSGGGRKR